MTEISEATERLSTLPASIEHFVLHWGALGSVWGVNRSVSQIHALLYVSEKPLTAEDISDALGMARSNVSTSIKELVAWGLVRTAPIKGDRRDHFEAETDVWEIAARIAAGRKQREVDPALAALRTCVAEAQADAATHRVARERLEAMLAFTERVARWHAQMATIPKSKLAGLLDLGTKIIKVLPFGTPRDRRTS